MTKMIVYFSKNGAEFLNNNPKWNSMISNANTNLKNQHYKIFLFYFHISLSDMFKYLFLIKKVLLILKMI